MALAFSKIRVLVASNWQLVSGEMVSLARATRGRTFAHARLSVYPKNFTLASSKIFWDVARSRCCQKRAFPSINPYYPAGLLCTILVFVVVIVVAEV